VGDDEFAAFVRGAQRRLVRYADMLCGDRGRAEDLVQHALLKTYLAWRRVGAGNPEAYARTVVSHAYVDWWRRRTWRETPTGELPEPATPHTDHADALARRDIVMRALSQLSPRERAMVSLRHLYGLSEAEVARELGCPIGTVKSGTARALAKLRADPLLRADQAILADEPEPTR